MTINKAIILGSLGNDPKIGTTQNGKEYASFSIATSKKWKDQDGNKKEETAWHNISVWGSLVKVCQYLEKGSKIYLEGEIKYEKYTDKDGVEKQGTKIIASLIDIIKGKDKEEDSFDKAVKMVDKHNAAKANSYVEEFDDELPPF